MPQTVTLNVSGLHTQNQYLTQVPPGALLECINFNHDRDGILEKRRGFFVYGNTFGTTNDRLKQLFSYKNRVIRHYNDVLEYDDGTGTFTAFTGSFTEPDGDTLRMKSVEANGNFYFTSDGGIMRISAQSASDFSSITVDEAGGTQALNLKTKADYSTPGFLSALSKVGYRVVWGFKDNNGNLILGKPSPLSILTNTSETETCVATLEFPIPEDITSNHFYQIYRSALVTAATVNDLDDISPEDELYLVIEEFPPTLTGTVTTTDITPDDFRTGGTLLYTNPISGEGINQANTPPPLAKDISSYSNYTFYANTKTVHRLDLNLLSLTDFVSGDTKLVISDGSTADIFTFVGDQAESSIVWATANYATKSALRGTYFLVRTASDERVYFVYFDDDGTTPEPSNAETIGKLPLKIDLSALAASPTNEQIVDQMIIDLTNNLDFDSTNTNKVGAGTDVTLNIVNCCNGNTPTFHISNSSTVPVPTPAGGSITFNDQNTAGDGEDASLKEILLSSKLTPGQQVEESANSIVEIVNAQSTGITYADYVSSVNDVPGLMSFESRVMSDTTFYVGMAETTPGANEKFNPTLPLVLSISGFTPTPTAGGTITTITSTAHGYSNGDTVVIFNNSDINGVYEISGVTANTFDITKNTFGASSGTANVYLATIASDNEESENRIYYSKLQQPEAVPIVNFIDIGPKDEAIQRIIGLRDSLFILKTDGVYRLSGTTPNTFTVQLFDSSAKIISPDSAKVLNNQIIAATEQGIVAISDTGVEILSKPIENLINNARLNTNFGKYSFAVSSETDRAYHFWTTSKRTDISATQCFRYNSDTNSWSIWDLAKTCGVINEDEIFLGSADQNTIEKERKSLDRTDHADREYSVQLSIDGINETTISTLSSLTNIDKGDVLYQLQYLTIAEVNRLLRKLDLDNLLFDSIVSITTGSVTTIEVTAHDLATDDYVLIDSVTGSGSSLINGTHKVTVLNANEFTIPVNTALYTATNGRSKYAYEQNLEVSTGDSIITSLEAIATRLQTDVSVATADTTSKTGFRGSGSTFCYDTSTPPTTFATAQTVFNLITDRLNDLPELQFTNYFDSEGTKPYEELVIDVDQNAGTVEVYTTPIFIAGDMTIYKGISGKITWVPNHAGDPSLMKLITSGTIIFDTQNFSFGTVNYSSDNSKSFEGTEIIAQGIGIFGQAPFGEEGFGGENSSAPFRVIVPRNKARCRYLSPQFIHINGREQVYVFGTSFTIEATSERAYR